MSRHLLSNRCILATSDLEEGYSAIQQTWEKHTFKNFKGRYSLRWHHADLTKVGLSYVLIDYGAEVVCQPRTDAFRVLMPDAGRIDHRINGEEAAALPTHAVLHGPTQELELAIRPNRLFLLTFDGSFVRRSLSRRFDAAPAIETWAAGFPLDTPAAAAFRSLSRWVALELERPDSHLLTSPQMSANVERTLLGLLLDSLEGNCPQIRRRADDAAESCVRRIEEWMEAQVGEPVGIEDFAAHAGVSVRTVQTAFRRLRGCTPMRAFLHRRLERARQMLLQAGPQTTVTGVAADCGFFQFGRFAAQYRQAYGEAPSVTLETIRRRSGLISGPSRRAGPEAEDQPSLGSMSRDPTSRTAER